jgi:hypothetical protein
MADKAQIAVFLSAESKVAPEVIHEKLINLDGVAVTEYVGKEKILENVQNENSQLKSLVLTGDNPFNPYYLITPVHINLSLSKKLADKISKFEGVEDVAYDENLFTALEKTGQFKDYYKTFAFVITIIVLMLIIVKFVLRYIRDDADFLDYLFNLLIGLLTGAFGGGLFYLVSRKFIKADIMHLPLNYSIYFIAGGVLMVLLWEND